MGKSAIIERTEVEKEFFSTFQRMVREEYAKTSVWDFKSKETVIK